MTARQCILPALVASTFAVSIAVSAGDKEEPKRQVLEYGAPVGFQLATQCPERVTSLIVRNGNDDNQGIEKCWDSIRASLRTGAVKEREDLLAHDARRHILTGLQSRISGAQGAVLPTFVHVDGRKGDVANGCSYESAAAASCNGDPAKGLGLFTANCAACHQASGEGVPGAFPPPKDNGAVNRDDVRPHIRIVLTACGAPR
jgi:hypothetical protein